MDYNENQNFESNENQFDKEPTFLREEGPNKSIWYWIIAVLVLGLVAWYGYTAGWFTQSTKISPVDLNSEMSVDSNLGIEIPKNAAKIDNILIKTNESFPVQKTLVLKGNLNNGCTYLNDPQILREGNNFYVSLTTREEGEACSQALVPFEKIIELEVLGLPAGIYNVFVNGITNTFELSQDNAIDFTGGVDK